jgi:hypothetical protein
MANAFAFQTDTPPPYFVCKGASDHGAKKDQPAAGEDAKRVKNLGQRRATYAAFAFLVHAFTAVKKIPDFPLFDVQNNMLAHAQQVIGADHAMFAACQRFAAAHKAVAMATQQQARQQQAQHRSSGFFSTPRSARLIREVAAVGEDVAVVAVAVVVAVVVVGSCGPLPPLSLPPARATATTRTRMPARKPAGATTSGKTSAAGNADGGASAWETITKREKRGSEQRQ